MLQRRSGDGELGTTAIAGLGREMLSSAVASGAGVGWRSIRSSPREAEPWRGLLYSSRVVLKLLFGKLSWLNLHPVEAP